MDKEQLLYEIIDRIGQSQDQMREILVRMESDLKYHIKRTDLLQEEVAILRDALTEHLNKPFPWKKVGVVLGVISTSVGLGIKLGGFL